MSDDTTHSPEDMEGGTIGSTLVIPDNTNLHLPTNDVCTVPTEPRTDPVTARFNTAPTTVIETYRTSVTPATAKGTTCASIFTTDPKPTMDNHKPPIDHDSIAHAVETLHISHSTNHPHAGTPASTQPWNIVTSNGPKKPPTGTTGTTPSQEFGLAFERTTKGNNWSTDDLLIILQTIQTHDPKAMLSSADNKTKPTLVTAILHKAQKDIPWFTKFTAMKTMTWGKPSDGTTKIVFSFWLTSTIIKKDLAQLRMDSDFTEMLKGTNTYMKVTKLLEPHSKIVGYFLGKDITHTNRDDITNRLAAVAIAL